jgi:putative molybdopterin biosynthesis protein
MLAGGVLMVNVVKKPLVGIIPTGDEIVPPSADPGEGDIIEFNSTIFSGMIESRGGAVKVYPIVKDKLELIKAALQAALTECDAVLLNAGSSAGREDFSTQAIRETGEVVLHGIAIRPGKPAILGMSGKTPILGVPGYPVSGIIVLEQLFLPVLDALCGRAETAAALTDCTISQRLVSSLKYREFVRARVGCVDGRMIAVPLNRGAGVVSSFVKDDGIIDVPQDLEGHEAGDPVRVRLLRSRREIENTLVITGSHDPLIDEAADILKRAHYDSAVASSHVGSMGGILALKRREAHMGGIHLLDTETGAYNDSYIARYLPAGAVEKVPCVRRVQGLMVQKGNPKGIRAFSDIARISYVNRQKGSGTRILCDHLAHEAGLDTSAVYGYGREEYTHTAVAALIAAGSADAGLGIYSAAKLYDLDFIPICDEVYDLIVLKDAMNLTQVQRFLETISGPALRARLEKLGGYAWN